MSTISTVLAVILILVCVASALMDFRKPEKLVEEMKKLKVPVERLPLLGAIKILGAIGIAIGFQNQCSAFRSGDELSNGRPCQKLQCNPRSLPMDW